MTKLETKLYSTSSLSTGGRDGVTKSLDNSFELRLNTPKELGGPGGNGTNPEQLFASGYSACFLNAVKYICMQEKIKFSDESTCKGTVDIGPIDKGFGLEVLLEVNLPESSQEEAETLVNKAHQVCPYSNATRGNIYVNILATGSK